MTGCSLQTVTAHQLNRQRDVSLLCQFATSTFRYHFRRFATCALRYLQDISLPGRFATWTFGTIGRFDTRPFRYIPGRVATAPPDDKQVLTVSQITDSWRNVQRGSETSWHRNDQRFETSRWRNVQEVNRPIAIANRLRW